MAKVKYYYDSENLAYRKIKPRKRKKFAYVMLFLVASALFGGLSFILLLNTSFFETPKDRLLTREIENLKLNYAVLNKKIDQVDEVLNAIEDRDNNLYRAYFNTAPILDEQRKDLSKRVNRYQEFETARCTIQIVRRDSKISKNKRAVISCHSGHTAR
jgi:hypothetical protein